MRKEHAGGIFLSRKNMHGKTASEIQKVGVEFFCGSRRPCQGVVTVFAVLFGGGIVFDDGIFRVLYANRVSSND